MKILSGSLVYIFEHIFIHPSSASLTVRATSSLPFFRSLRNHVDGPQEKEENNGVNHHHIVVLVAEHPRVLLQDRYLVELVDVVPDQLVVGQQLRLNISVLLMRERYQGPAAVDFLQRLLFQIFLQIFLLQLSMLLNNFLKYKHLFQQPNHQL